jgi:5'-methylthioadenosine phosphorylase
MSRLALIAGSSLRGAGVPEGDWVIAQRHGEAAAYVLPDRIDHVANLRALADAGCDRVLALGSVGGLRQELGPGTLLCPDDFIALTAAPLTSLEGPAAHRAPDFDRDWRADVVAAFAAAGAELRDGGTYWQSTGPRLETPAEIRMIAAHADVIGMTVASEAVIAGELGLRYAAVCQVDNLANGVGEAALTLEQIEVSRADHREMLNGLLAKALPSLASTR